MKLENPNEFEIAICQIQRRLHQAVGAACEVTFMGRFLGLPLALADSLLEVIKACAAVVEHFFKGCANLGLAIKDSESRKERAWTGILMLRDGALRALGTLFFLPLVLLVYSITLPIILLFRGKAKTDDVSSTYQDKADKKLKANADSSAEKIKG